MLFAYFCTDRGDQTAARSRLLVEHLRYFESIVDKIFVSGTVPPTAPGDTRKAAGSVIIYNVGSREEADALFKGDPYDSLDLYEKVEVVVFNPAAGTAVGGISWDIVNGEVRRRKPA